MSTWPKKYRTFWCVVDFKGMAYLSTARIRRKNSINGWLAEAGKDWKWWRRHKWSCQRCDIKVRNAVSLQDRVSHE